MKKLSITGLVIFFAVFGIEMISAKKIVSKKTQRRHQAAKKALAERDAFSKNISGLSGQALIDALVKRIEELTAQIQTHRKNLVEISKHRGTHLGANGKKHLNKPTAQQKKEIDSNLNAISLATQEINSNKILIAKTQQALSQTNTQTTQKALIAMLSGKTDGKNTNLNPALQAAVNAALQAAQAQGASAQSAIDAIAIQNAYNQGYNDGQSASTNNTEAMINESTTTDASSTDLTCDDGSTPAMLCADGSPTTPCDDGSTQEMTCADGSTPGDTIATSICEDGSIANCQDGTSITLQPCTDGSDPDINGMCYDGNLVSCNDQTQPVCADGSAPVAA